MLPGRFGAASISETSYENRSSPGYCPARGWRGQTIRRLPTLCLRYGSVRPAEVNAFRLLKRFLYARSIKLANNMPP